MSLLCECAKGGLIKVFEYIANAQSIILTKSAIKRFLQASIRFNNLDLVKYIISQGYYKCDNKRDNGELVENLADDEK